MLGLESFRCTRDIIAGIETMHMGKEGQLNFVKDRASFAADKFYSLAFRSQPPWGFFQPLSVIATEPSSPARKRAHSLRRAPKHPQQSRRPCRIKQPPHRGPIAKKDDPDDGVDEQGVLVLTDR